MDTAVLHIHSIAHTATSAVLHIRNTVLHITDTAPLPSRSLCNHFCVYTILMIYVYIYIWVYRFSLALFDVVPGPLDLSST